MRYVLLFLFLSQTCCTTIRPPTSAVINTKQLRNHLEESFVFGKSDHISDNEYKIVTRKWITEEFKPHWFSYKTRNNLIYRFESSDCDNFSLHCLLAAQELSSDGKPICVGYLAYRKSITGPHAINIFLIEENDKIKVIFFEPQTDEIIGLSKAELASCFFWMF